MFFFVKNEGKKGERKKNAPKKNKKKEGQGGGSVFSLTHKKKKKKKSSRYKNSLYNTSEDEERGASFFSKIYAHGGRSTETRVRGRDRLRRDGPSSRMDGARRRRIFFFHHLGIRVVENIFEITVRNIRERKRMMMMRRTKSLVRSVGLRSLSGTSFRKPRKDERHFGGATDETRASSLSLSLSL